jgi:sugar fermentation stimulation protein A
VKIARPLHRGVLLRRYKRFLADVRLDDGREVTVHCPNSGSMLGLDRAGAPVVVSDSGDPKRKLRMTLERVRPGRAWVGVNTMLPNHLVRAAVEAGRVPELRGYPEVRSEVVLQSGTRLDLRLSGGSRPSCWVEVKNVTLRAGRAALFPDAVTERGRKHLEALASVVARGERGVLLFVVNRADCVHVAPADAIDPGYGETLRRVAGRGVEVLARRARMRGDRTWLAESVPVLLR